MTTDETTPGTTADGTATAAGTTVDGSLSESERQELESLRSGKQQWLGERSKFEETSAENEELRKRLEAQGSQPPIQPGVDPIALEIQAQYQELYLRALQGDPHARFEIAKIEGVNRSLAQIRIDSQLAAMPQPVQGRVRAMLEQNQRLDVQTAREIVEGQIAREELQKRQSKEEEQRRIADETVRASTATGATSVRSAPPSTPENGTMKASDFNSRLAALKERADNGDAAAKAEALALGRKVDRGEITLVLNK